MVLLSKKRAPTCSDSTTSVSYTHLDVYKRQLQTRPKTMRITVDGKLGTGVTAKDVALYMMSKMTTSGATGYFVEYIWPYRTRHLNTLLSRRSSCTRLLCFLLSRQPFGIRHLCICLLYTSFTPLMSKSVTIMPSAVFCLESFLAFMAATALVSRMAGSSMFRTEST